MIVRSRRLSAKSIYIREIKLSDPISNVCTDLYEIFDLITDLRLNRLVSLIMNDVRCPFEDLGCHCVKHLRL